MSGPASTPLSPQAPVPRKCRACCEPIADQATICKTCHQYQSAWRNEASFWASAAGVITLSFAALTFSYSQMISTFDASNLQIAAFNPKHLVLLNSGSKTVTARYIEINAKRVNASEIENIFTTLSPNEVKTIPLRSDDDHVDILEKPTPEQMAGASLNRSDLFPVFGTDDDPAMRHVIDVYAKLKSNPVVDHCTLTLFYSDAGSEKVLSKSFGCLVMIATPTTNK